LNIGLIGGGDTVNVVPENAWAVLDIRFWTTRDKDQALKTIRGLAPTLRGAKIRSALEGVTPPLEMTKASSALFEEAKKIAAGLGLASVAAGVGVAALDGLGPDGDGLHADHEHLLLSSLVSRTALLTELFLRL
jgi:glutamate carboxypeptidase